MIDSFVWTFGNLTREKWVLDLSLEQNAKYVPPIQSFPYAR